MTTLTTDFAVTAYTYRGGVVSLGATNKKIGMVNNVEERLYLHFTLPALPPKIKIHSATLTLLQSAVNSSYQYGFGICQLQSDITVGNSSGGATTIMDYDRMYLDGNTYTYEFDIRSIMAGIISGENPSTNLGLRLMNLTSDSNSYITVSTTPTITLLYETDYSISSGCGNISHNVGKLFGSVDLRDGNLMLESTDFAWDGNRMPITLTHTYNGALAGIQYTNNVSKDLECADFSAMKLGYGWKLNIMQSIIADEFDFDGYFEEGYVHMDENCKKTHFWYVWNGSYLDTDWENEYLDYEQKLLINGESRYFDDEGRLIKITDESGNSMTVTYENDRIAEVNDGAGRAFRFTYNSLGNLTSISAPDSSSVNYTYNGNYLSSIIYPDASKTIFTYDSSGRVIKSEAADSSGILLSKAEYTYTGNSVSSVKEYGYENGASIEGVNTLFLCAPTCGRTTVEICEPPNTSAGETEGSVYTTVYTFGDNDEMIGSYATTNGSDNVGFTYSDDSSHIYYTDKESKLFLSTPNLIRDPNFTYWGEYGMYEGDWNINYKPDYNANVGIVTTDDSTPYRNSVMYIDSSDETSYDDVYQRVSGLSAGSYTLSAYVRVDRAFNGSMNDCGVRIGNSRPIKNTTDGFVRVEYTFEMSEAGNYTVYISTAGNGKASICCVQLENNSVATPYDLIINGGCERLSNEPGMLADWSNAPVGYAAFAGEHSMCLEADYAGGASASQNISVNNEQTTRETFTLSAWAKGYGAPERERVNATPKFDIYATIHYSDETTETFVASYTPSLIAWQFATVSFAKSKFLAVDHIEIGCEYLFNYGTAEFDNIMLKRDSIETGLTEKDFATVTEEEDTSDEEEDDEETFEDAKDAYSNPITETSYIQGGFGAIYRSYEYDENGNNRIRETDHRGLDTVYAVDETTSRISETTDRCGNKTAYEYDSVGRTTKVTSKNSNSLEIAHVSYSYDALDNMTEIARGDGMKYSLVYNGYHNLESIGISGKSEPLIEYSYTKGGRLKRMSYANGHTMVACYNGIGRLVSEKWYSDRNLTTLIADYSYAYDGNGNIRRSIDFILYK